MRFSVHACVTPPHTHTRHARAHRAQQRGASRARERYTHIKLSWDGGGGPRLERRLPQLGPRTWQRATSLGLRSLRGLRGAALGLPGMCPPRSWPPSPSWAGASVYEGGDASSGTHDGQTAEEEREHQHHRAGGAAPRPISTADAPSHPLTCHHRDRAAGSSARGLLLPSSCVPPCRGGRIPRTSTCCLPCALPRAAAAAVPRTMRGARRAGALLGLGKLLLQYRHDATRETGARPGSARTTGKRALGGARCARQTCAAARSARAPQARGRARARGSAPPPRGTGVEWSGAPKADDLQRVLRRGRAGFAPEARLCVRLMATGGETREALLYAWATAGACCASIRAAHLTPSMCVEGCC